MLRHFPSQSVTAQHGHARYIYLSVDLMMVAFESLAPDVWNSVWIYITSVLVHTIDNMFYILTDANTVSMWSVCWYVEEITDLGSLQWNYVLRNIHCGLWWHCVIVLLILIFYLMFHKSTNKNKVGYRTCQE